MFRTLLLTFALTASAAFAADTPASEASIREVLQVTEARKLLDGMFPQIEATMKASMQQALKGHTPNPEQQHLIDKMTEKTMAMMHEEMSWEKLEPMYVRTYQKTFTQEELDGVLAFYKSPAGAALIKKMPVLMKEIMGDVQTMMGSMMQKIQAVTKETVEEIQAEEQK
jgi:hypothetical protein